MSKFIEEMMLDFKDCESIKSLHDIAKRYVSNCDSHDDKVLTGRNEKGESMPLRHFERRQMLIFSREQMRIAEKYAARLGYSYSELKRAIQEEDNRI